MELPHKSSNSWIGAILVFLLLLVLFFLSLMLPHHLPSEPFSRSNHIHNGLWTLSLLSLPYVTAFGMICAVIGKSLKNKVISVVAVLLPLAEWFLFAYLFWLTKQ